ncbi:MAG: class I SAM-dependent methyltransferase [Thermoplasmata archaeon]|nr:class I SAM-dependent methyltransferase [Thermoplasmata archaeon]
MTWKYTDEYYLEYTRTTWNESAESYVALMKNLEPFRQDLIARLDPRAGESVLDLGTGPGEPAMTVARIVGATGRVLGVDLSENMVSIARQVAETRGLRNVEFRVRDCADLDVADASFDCAMSSFGFQIFTDPEKAAREAYRALKPGGRIGVAVWSTGPNVPFLDALVGPMLEHAEPDESGYLPTPYETGGPGEMVAFLEAAGFPTAKEGRVTHYMKFADAQQYLDTLLKATPIGHSLSEETEPIQQAVLQKTRKNLEPWTNAAGVSIPAEAVLVVARKG